MSRPIKLTEQIIQDCRNDFEKVLRQSKMTDGKISFTKALPCGNQKATVIFSAFAWAKMVALITSFDKEVAWHGVASRYGTEDQDEYYISDIVVYPQEVSGATVEMDVEKYAKWLAGNGEDERFNNIHMQGHSHVNMATTPSSVDLTHQEEILSMLEDDDFYIFMIWNKSFTSTNKIYDLKKNILFENSDITVKVAGEVEGLSAFIENAKTMVVSKTYQYQKYGSSINDYTGRDYNHSGYRSDYYYDYQDPYSGYRTNMAPVSPYNPAQKTDSQRAEPANAEKTKKPKSRIGAGWIGKDATKHDKWGGPDID